MPQGVQQHHACMAALTVFSLICAECHAYWRSKLNENPGRATVRMMQTHVAAEAVLQLRTPEF